MSQSLSLNLIHLIYSTKNRVCWLTPEIHPKLCAYQAGIFQECQSPALVLGGEADHVHALFLLSKNHALCTIIEKVKSGSTNWLKVHHPSLADFRWQSGYGAFSVSQSQADQVKGYIDRQIEHHRVRSFQDEFRLFLKRHKMEYDERYVWD